MFNAIDNARQHAIALKSGIPPYEAYQPDGSRDGYGDHIRALMYTQRYVNELVSAFIADLQTMAVQNNGIALDYFQTFAGEWVAITFIIAFDSRAVIKLNGVTVDYEAALDWIASVL